MREGLPTPACGVAMIPRRQFLGRDLDWTGPGERRCPARESTAASRGRRHRPGVECLEGRPLLAPIMEFPLPAGSFVGTLTAGSDGNLWYPESSQRIGRIAPTGTVTEFPLPGPSIVGT